MARILFTADLEEGNIFASFGLAKQLKNSGHDIFYVGVVDAEALIRGEGFDFYSLLKSSYPSGSKYSTGSFMSTAESRGALCKLLLEQNGELESLMRAFRPDVIVVPPYMALESLILHLRYRPKIVHLRSAYIVEPREEAIARSCAEILDGAPHADEVAAFLLQCGIAIEGLTAIIERISQFHEFVTLPEGYEVEATPPRSNTFYIGATLDTARKEEPFDWTTVNPDSRLIYCTLGSQSHRDAAKSEKFFRVVLEAVAERDEWFLIMAVGKGSTNARFKAPANAYIAEWTPQLEVLSRAKMMIMHGGMGTTRECIFRQVPMLVNPLMRDQFASAEAICRHGLGVLTNTESPSKEDLQDKVESVLNRPNIYANLRSMRDRFVAADRRQSGVYAVEQLVRVLC